MGPKVQEIYERLPESVLQEKRGPLVDITQYVSHARRGREN